MRQLFWRKLKLKQRRKLRPVVVAPLVERVIRQMAAQPIPEVAVVAIAPMAETVTAAAAAAARVVVVAKAAAKVE